jgi:hypothetical protein
MNLNRHIVNSNKRFRWLILLLFEFIFFLSAAFAQNDTVDKKIISSFNQYRSRYFQEKLFVHTDKDSYISREICWFRIYYVDAFYNRPASLSKIAYIEILDKRNRPVLQQKVSLKPGESNGSLIIPVTVSSGTYILRAYTSWMKNSSPDYYFQKSIRILNPREPQPEQSSSKTKHYDIQFFPEGGNFVQDIETRVGFRITDVYGKGLDCEGILLNSNSDTILRFHPMHLGLGHFVFTPTVGQNYRAVIRFPLGEQAIKELPPSYSNGYVMNVSKTSEGEIAVNVRVTGGFDGQEIYLFTHGRHSLLSVKRGRLVNRKEQFVIKTQDMEDGVSQITLFDKAGQPVCERLYFKYPEKKMMILTEINPAYGIREKIDVNLLVKDQVGSPLPANMSLAVYRLDSLQQIDETDIRNYLYLSSDLGAVESPAFYFNGDERSREENMDNLMLTQGWRRFVWKDLLQNATTPLEFSPELNGHFVQGRLVNNNTGAAAAGINVYFSIPSARTQFRVTTSNADGKVKFEMPGFYGSQEIILQTNPAEDSSSHVEMISPFSNQFSGNLLPILPLPPGNSATLLDQSIDEQVQHIYKGTQLNQFTMQAVDTNSFYVEPDEKYLLDDYTRFQTMEEVLREYVRSVSVSRKQDKFQLHLEDKAQREFFGEGPLILIDGVPFFDADELFHQDPMRIKRLDLMNREYSLGYQNFKGIINLTTYQGDLNGIQMNSHATVLDYPGIPEQREFFSPVYETEDQINSPLPDFRTLLYWAPDIQSGDQGTKLIHFYSSDLPGRYAVVIMGLTETGIPGSQVFYFSVKK